MSRLSGKVAIVTGAGGGIGRAICRGLAREGAAVVCIDIDPDTAERTAEAARGEGGRALALALDVSEEVAAEKAVAGAVGEFGMLNVLVCNAVHDLALGPVTGISLADWRRSTAVNLDSAFLFSKCAIPAMEQAGGGSIVLIASELARVAKAGRPWYCAQKAALVHLARAMAVDHAHQRIRVNSLSPGPVETGRYLRNHPNLEAARASSETLLNRLGDPDEIAAGALFLASEESSFMTGADLLIDGGRTAV